VREDFDDELAGVGRLLVTMARTVREGMRQASAALLGADHTSAQQVIIRAVEVGVLYRLLDDRVVGLISRHQPVADDLRAALTALQAGVDLERMNVLAAHVARATLRRQPEPAVGPELAELFRAMSSVADVLAEKIVLALAGSDAGVAARLDGDDDAMDRLHRQLFEVILSPVWPLSVEAAVDGALLGRYYERYADHAVNVGRHVLVLPGGR
jgi:phosphate transport system protein